MENNLNLLELDLYYSSVDEFIKKHNNINYMQFDYLVANSMNLFSSVENIDFIELSSKLDNIIAVIPAIKRIFSKPIIHLNENDELVPLEAARLVNNDTLNYASIHTELWDDITPSGIKPYKLLSRKYLDNYAIYENVVFARCIDVILAFSRKYNNMLRDLIYVGGKFKVNLLEKTNHLSYYLALGKLHTGYIRSFENYRDIAVKCLNKIEYILAVITPRLSKPVYKINKNNKKNFHLHKTNILGMNKDYYKIYLLLKKFYKTDDIKIDVSNFKNLDKNYQNYLTILTIFAAGHFNFVADDGELIDFNKLNYNLKFKEFRLNIKRVKGGLLLTFKKDVEYKIMLIPKIVDYAEVRSVANEYVYVTPYEGNDIFISINNIESFRRIQQILLRGMIYSDNKRDICPFCGAELEKRNNDYVCPKCATLISKRMCLQTEKVFVVTSIDNYEAFFDDTKSKWLRERQSEAIYHFRNITAIKNGEFVCPYCKMVH